ncbi:imidazole glycerol phosphate synthase subunit HisF [Chryseotalea sanaruensis]|uniref:imidazole glycerol-phosphate synthase n=1 Tax=Chryseotalea sanaruensis TaxID=2482724 RepID=A0A401UC33_9BACT|nr:AglZ/HisF2 family acetamidino modification protein [Chryseotalea sanaruensis]GCC52463.1 imidazole glycerol phosphate synthase subunit HisF [Chryseotalea sanaruensis]
MLKTRIIPCLLLKDGGLVKTIKFANPKYVGDPINAVKIFNEKEVDELIFLDIEASRQKRDPNYDLIKDLASECFMPFAYGGGVTTIDQIRKILRLGVEKVVINAFAIKQPAFIKEASTHFGSSTIIAAVDIKKDFWGHYKVYDHVARKITNKDPEKYIQELVNEGAGEIFLNNVDRDGTYLGLDLPIVARINSQLPVPLIICGGISSLKNIKDAVEQTKVSGAAAGSIFVFQGPHRAVLISYPSYNELKEIVG